MSGRPQARAGGETRAGCVGHGCRAAGRGAARACSGGLPAWCRQEPHAQRDKSVGGREHIPGAISLPHRTMKEDTTKHLDQEYLYVTYCDGIGCNASTKGALKMARLGFTVKELIGGLDWWKRDGYPTEGSASTAGSSVSCAC